MNTINHTSVAVQLVHNLRLLARPRLHLWTRPCSEQCLGPCDGPHLPPVWAVGDRGGHTARSFGSSRSPQVHPWRGTHTPTTIPACQPTFITYHAVSDKIAITSSPISGSMMSSYVSKVMYSWSAVVLRTCSQGQGAGSQQIFVLPQASNLWKSMAEEQHNLVESVPSHRRKLEEPTKTAETKHLWLH